MTGADRAAGQESPIPHPAEVDDGFTLVETMISIFLVGVVMAALTSFFVSTLALTNRQSGIQTASQVATDAIATIRSIKGARLATGRDAASSVTQWASPQPGVAGYLADMAIVSDSTAQDGAGKTAALPTSAVSVTLSNLDLKQFFYLGSCWQPAGGGPCTQAQPAGSVPFFRAVVAVTWPDQTCAASLCSLVTSTLVSSASTDPLFNSNDAATAPAPTNPGDRDWSVNSAVNLQLTSTGGAAPKSWSFTGLPPGVVPSSSGLLSGTLAGTVGTTYPVTATVTDAFGLSSSTTFGWTVQTYPMAVAEDGPWAYYRGEESAAATATLVAADSSGKSRAGTYNGRTDGPSTFWKFQENSGSTTADSSGATNTGTLGNTPTWTTTGKFGNALTFNGTTQHVSGARAAVDTSRAFTVAAWVYLTDKSLGRVAISQSGSITSGFMLRYNRWADQWDFLASRGNSYSSTWDYSSSAGGSAPLSTWTHLVGVYDGAGTIRLYVNGVAQTAGAHTSPWNATGALNVGRDWDWGGWQGANDGWAPWHGRVDEVRVYQRALTAAEITSLGSGGAYTEAGMTAGVTGALQGVQQGLQATTAFAYTGGTTNGYGNTSQNNPNVFTIECWFRTNSTTGGWLVGLGSTTTGVSATKDRLLYLDSGNKLTFGVYPNAIKTIRSPATYNDNAWHHAAASLGAAGMRLYVDGALVASDATITTAQNYTGYWRWAGANLDFWPNRPATDYYTGLLDEVAIYDKQLSDQRIAAHYQSNQ